MTLSTGPIENNPVSGVRPTQQLTIKIDNRDLVNMSNILIQGWYLNGIRVLYVLELVSLGPNQVLSRNYYTNFNAFEFVFITSGLAKQLVQISTWGMGSTGQLVSAHRLVASEQFGEE